MRHKRTIHSDQKELKKLSTRFQTFKLLNFHLPRWLPKVLRCFAATARRTTISSTTSRVLREKPCARCCWRPSAVRAVKRDTPSAGARRTTPRKPAAIAVRRGIRSTTPMAKRCARCSSRRVAGIRSGTTSTW